MPFEIAINKVLKIDIPIEKTPNKKPGKTDTITHTQNETSDTLGDPSLKNTHNELLPKEAGYQVKHESMEEQSSFQDKKITFKESKLSPGSSNDLKEEQSILIKH